MSVSLQFGYVIVSVTSFTIGIIVGWSSAQELDNLSQPELRRLMAVILLAMYVVSVLAEIRLEDYQTPLLLHGMMGAVIGYLFSSGDDNGFSVFAQKR